VENSVQSLRMMHREERFNSATAVTPWKTLWRTAWPLPGWCFNSATAVTPWKTTSLGYDLGWCAALLQFGHGSDAVEND